MELRFRIGLRASISVALAWGVLFMAVFLAARVPAREYLKGLEVSQTLDYSALPRFLTPLSDTFIERELGPASERSAHEVASSRSSEASASGVGPITQRKIVRHPLTNDSPDDAYPIASVPFTGRTNTQTATRDGDPTDCGAVGGTVWYRYTPPRNMGVIAYTFGTDHAVALGVFEKQSGAWKAVTACDTDEEGNALIHFQATRGTTYLFQVTDVVRGGDLRFSLDPQGSVTLASKNATGASADRDTFAFNTTPDGRYVAMGSFAGNLIDDNQPNCDRPPPQSYAWFSGGQATPCSQDYVYDRVTRSLVAASTSASGELGNSDTLEGAISGDGRFYVFESDASNLGPKDPMGYDLFLKDLRTGAVELIVTSADFAPTNHPESAGASTAQHVEGNNGLYFPSISEDGRYVAFNTVKAILPKDTNLVWDVYVYDRILKRYELATVSSNEKVAEPSAQRDANLDRLPDSELAVDLTPYLSPDGRFVVFRSTASNLVDGDTNQTWDTFVRDRWQGTTERVSISSSGEQGNGESMERLSIATATITPDGHYVVFDSLATNLAPDPPTLAGVNSVYLRDRWAGTTRRIGISGGENQPVTSHYPSISRNGRFITYTIWGPRTDVASCDQRGYQSTITVCTSDVFVYDMVTDTTVPVTVAADGSIHHGFRSSVSEDGRIVTFHSYAPDSSIIQVYVYEAARAR